MIRQAGIQGKLVKFRGGPVFDWIYAQLYKAVLSLYTGLLRFYPQIKRAYLRGSFAERNDWAPFLSDLDTTIVIKDMNCAETFLFLKRFWRSSGWFKRVFPILGEIEILSEEEE
ncbi:MAG: hypothetical protein PHR73_04395, partial [Candidatus Omnitrophica bacterium]|nr:hypothetical protein [Candidatus Omnitrophota bacterium]